MHPTSSHGLFPVGTSRRHIPQVSPSLILSDHAPWIDGDFSGFKSALSTQQAPQVSRSGDSHVVAETILCKKAVTTELNLSASS
jgi:hypothetical protein